MHPQITLEAFEYFCEPGKDYLSPIKFAKIFSLDRPSLARLLKVSPAYLQALVDFDLCAGKS